MEENVTLERSTNLATVQQSPVIPANPNIVEMVTLLEDPNLHAKKRSALRRELHDTVHLVKKQDGRIHAARSGQTRVNA